MRTSAAKVREIAEVDPTITSLTPWLDMAALVVEEQIAPIGTLSEARLTMIETLLAAHFLKSERDPLSTSESAGGVSASYLISGGEMLKATPYGQKAIALDTTGTLARMSRGAGPSGSVVWMGRETTT